MKSPFPNSYWLVPKKIICGEYPRNPDDETDSTSMTALLKAGTRTFIDLTHPGELKPYREIALNTADALKIDQAELTFHRFPITDASIPKSQDEMANILSVVDESWQAGKGVYIHCYGGKGRTGTVAGCLLSEHLNCDGADALRALQEKWKNCAKSAQASSPETDQQCGFIRKWDRRGQWFV